MFVKKKYIRFLMLSAMIVLLSSCSASDEIIGSSWHQEFLNCTIDFAVEGVLTLVDEVTTTTVTSDGEIEEVEIFTQVGSYTWDEESSSGTYAFDEDSTIGREGGIVLDGNDLTFTSSENNFYVFEEK